jgi:hypothetical protein
MISILNRSVSILAFLTLQSSTEMAFSKTSAKSVAMDCVTRFSQQMKNIVSYETTIQKREKPMNGSWRSDHIRLTESDRGNRIQIVYLNEGSTGIKSNGMKVTYKSGEDISIIYGESKGIGGLFGSIAKTAAPKSMRLTDGLAINEELFTINRAGFRFMSQMILKGLENSKGKLEGSETHDECFLKWVPIEADYQEIQIAEGQSIWSLEETYSTLASLIQRKNSELFPRLSDLFRVRGPKKILVPRSFTAFSTTLNRATNLPKSFQLYWEGQLVGEYFFSDTRVLARD